MSNTQGLVLNCHELSLLEGAQAVEYGHEGLELFEPWVPWAADHLVEFHFSFPPKTACINDTIIIHAHLFK